MGQCVWVELADSVPEDASVYHYDELDDDAKDRFPTLADASSEASTCTDCDLSNGDYVKFTDYYRVRCV